jgi:hypothetical protein
VYSVERTSLTVTYDGRAVDMPSGDRYALGVAGEDVDRSEASATDERTVTCHGRLAETSSISAMGGLVAGCSSCSIHCWRSTP